MSSKTESAGATAPIGKKPRLALAIATVFGVGYLPKAPGTFGSIVGVFLAVVAHPVSLLMLIFGAGGFGLEAPSWHGHPAAFLLLAPAVVVLLGVAMAGVWTSSRVAAYALAEDPQYVVIDEVSGQHLTLLLALAPIGLPVHVMHGSELTVVALYFGLSLLNWKYLLAGFILFRVFDIWKPYPIRHLEKLPGGWGIMADDWMAGIYAAIVLRLALHLGLL